MKTQANKLEALIREGEPSSSLKRTKYIAITSGKGGVGKSTLSANLANTMAKNGYKVGLFDADIGLANLDVILNVRVNKNILHVLKGEVPLSEIIVHVKKNLLLIPGESGDEILKYNDQFLYERFFEETQILDDLDFIIIDTGAGIGGHTQHFLEASDEVIVVTVPDPAAITDAYATIKITSKIKSTIHLVLNMTKSIKEAELIYEKITKVANANIKGLNLNFLGRLPEDKIISKSIKQRTLFSDDAPNGTASHELRRIANNLIFKLEHKVLKSEEGRGFGGFIKNLIDRF